MISPSGAPLAGLPRGCFMRCFFPPSAVAFPLTPYHRIGNAMTREKYAGASKKVTCAAAGGTAGWWTASAGQVVAITRQ